MISDSLIKPVKRLRIRDSETLATLGWWCRKAGGSLRGSERRAGLAHGRDTLRAAPGSGPVRTTAASGPSDYELTPSAIAVVEALGSSGVVTVALSAGGLMTGFDCESIVVGGEDGINCRAPFPLKRYAGSTVGAEGTQPIHRIDATTESAGGYRPSETRQEDLVVSLDRHGRRPGIGHGVEGGGAASGARRKDDLRVGSRELIWRSALREVDCGIGERDRRSAAWNSAGSEVCVEPDVSASVDGSAVEVRRVYGLRRAWWRRGGAQVRLEG